MPATRSRVVISNFWHRPEIKVTVIYDEQKYPRGAIFLEMSLNDFMLAVLAEMKHPFKLLSRKRLNQALENAYNIVLDRAKLSSTEGVR